MERNGSRLKPVTDNRVEVNLQKAATDKKSLTPTHTLKRKLTDFCDERFSNSATFFCRPLLKEHDGQDLRLLVQAAADRRLRSGEDLRPLQVLRGRLQRHLHLHHR